ncbi:MAG TPA: HlyD family efflux transporter periplasmic adaptor subunit [Pirellulales bacterium]|nr:HlyD family efflux transporter periplasmic adaptor subunit [Pirellulales bacterium]
MSSESSSSSVDAEYVQATKQQVRNMVAEIAQLAKSDADPSQFYEAILTRAVSALVATGGAIWILDDDGRLQLQYQINLQSTGVAQSEEGQTRHYRLLQQALGESSGMLVAPQSGAEGNEEAGNPTDWLLVLGALVSNRAPRGVIEIFQRPGAGPVTQRGYLRFLLQLCELGGNYLATRQLRSFEDRQSLWGQLEQFTKTVHESLDPIRTAYTVVNEGRRLIECDRVSLAIWRGRKCRVEAISHQDTIDKRSNIAVLLSRLATRVVATGEPLWYGGSTEDMPPQVEDAVHEYVDESHAKVVGVLPLFKPQEAKEEAEEDEKKPDVLVGALIVEQFDQTNIAEQVRKRVDVVKDHASSALANAIQHDSIFLMPLWRTLGQWSWVLRARTLPKTVTIAALILALIVALIVIPIDFDIEARGQLQPEEQRDVFVEEGGLIEHIFEGIAHGARVQKGQELLRLSSLDLQGQITDIEGQSNATNEQLRWIRNSLAGNDADLAINERHQLRGQQMQLRKTGQSLKEQLEVLKEKQKRLTLLSPIDGVIVTWDVRQRLYGRTVEPGQVVLSVAQPEKNWELELEVPDDRIGFIAEREAELAHKDPPETIGVTYILATSPEKKMEGTVKEIQETAEVRDDQSNTFLVLVDINRDSIDPNQLRMGTSVTAKLACGQHSIGFVLFHDMYAWIQTKILFRL